MTERVQNMMPVVTDQETRNPVIHYGFAEIERMANYVAKSGMFGIKTPEQGVALMMLAQAEGLHPMIAARDYDIIQGRPSKKAEAMLRDFQRAGGAVQWHELTDSVARATFSHPQGGSVTIDWTLDRAKKAGLGNKDMWTKFPRQMLRSRCVSEGCKTVWPSATSGMYTPEETQDFLPQSPRDITPQTGNQISANDRLQALQGDFDKQGNQAAKKSQKAASEAPDGIEQASSQASSPWIWIAASGQFREFHNSAAWLETLRAGLHKKSADECTELMSRMNDTFNALMEHDRAAVEEAQAMINERFIEASNV